MQLTIAEIVAILAALTGLAGWVFRMHSNASNKIAALEATIHDVVKANAQMVANLTEATHSAVEHLRELIGMNATTNAATCTRIETAVGRIQSLASENRERLIRIEAAANGRK